MKYLNLLAQIVGTDRVIIDPEALGEYLKNSLGLERSIAGVLLPSSIEEVVEIVTLANKEGLKLYPISRGQNLGYGQTLPAGENQWIVDLKRLDKIEFDPETALLSVEPGVTQQKLYEFLRDRHPEFQMDATGAGLEASIVGNALEGGFGHSPMANHRREIREIEIVLGNGHKLKTGEFPGLGPDLSGVFVQSNFGIIVGMKIGLMRKSECFESILITLSRNDEIFPLLERLKNLKSQGTITSPIHIPNAIRSLMSTRALPQEYKNKMIEVNEAVALMDSPIVKAAYWTGITGIYGSSEEVKAKKKRIRQELQGVAKVRFFSTEKLNFLKYLLGLFGHIPLLTILRKNLESFHHIHNLALGIPTDEPFRNVYWRIDKPEDLGLLWIGPTIPASSEALKKFLELSQPIYRKYGFEFSLTINLLEPTQIIAILSITFNKNIESEKERATKAYQELHKEFEGKGIRIYRSGILGMPHIKYDKEKAEVLHELKKVFDPHGIISPGRYNIK